MARPKSLVLPSDPLLLQALLKGLAIEKQELDAKMSAVYAALGKGRPGRKPKAAAAAPAEAASGAAPAKKRRTLSAAARARIAAAQKKRWAAFKKKEGQ
jgi:hypothetical protein